MTAGIVGHQKPVLRLEMPYPPTLNHYLRIVTGRRGTAPRMLRTDEAVRYKADIALAARRRRVRPQDGPLFVHVRVYRPRRVGDIDNTLKVLLDALNGIAWHDDAQIVRLLAERHDDKTNPRAELDVYRFVPGAEE